MLPEKQNHDTDRRDSMIGDIIFLLIDLLTDMMVFTRSHKVFTGLLILVLILIVFFLFTL